MSSRRVDRNLRLAASDSEDPGLDALLREVMEAHDADVLDDMVQLVEALSAVLRPVSASPQFLRELGLQRAEHV